VTKTDYDKMLSKLIKIGAAFEAPAEQAYRLGFMLEDAHFLAEAYQYYSKAATLDSANVLYRSTLMSFKKDYEIK
jgi:TPR repeat protein